MDYLLKYPSILVGSGISVYFLSRYQNNVWCVTASLRRFQLKMLKFIFLHYNNCINFSQNYMQGTRSKAVLLRTMIKSKNWSK